MILRTLISPGSKSHPLRRLLRSELTGQYSQNCLQSQLTSGLAGRPVIAFSVRFGHHARVVITLLTDFGGRDWFVPSLKGVILGIAPRARIVDVTHEIQPQDVRAGAFMLAAVAGAFPRGTIHVAVVDPGVGSRRKAIAVKTRRSILIGPDNGLLSLAAEQQGVVETRALENPRLFRQPVSDTFHGRDVFAPVAAHLARGTRFAAVGPRYPSIRRLRWPEPRRSRAGFAGEIIHIDHYGNLITNISADEVTRGCRVRIGRRRLGAISSGYSGVARGEAIAVINSLGLLEIGVRDGNAARSMRLGCGAVVLVQAA